MKRTLTVIAALLVLALVPLPNAYASIITLSTPGIVGLTDMNAATDAADPAARLGYANTLIGMGANENSPNPIPTNNSEVIGYQTGPVDYTGSFNEAPTVTTGNVVPAGAGYVLAKYDGPNGGYVLFYIPDWGGTTIPSQAGYATWDPVGGNGPRAGDIQEYGLSGYTVYTSVPDGGSVAMMLGMALVGLAGVRRMLK